MSTAPLLKRLDRSQVESKRRDPVDAQTLAAAAEIVQDVRERGTDALRAHGERLGDLEAGAPLIIERGALEAARDELPTEDRELLTRTAAHIRRFASRQLACISGLETDVPGGGRAGHAIAPMEVAGCYAPGGRFPLPSSVLMTAVTARAAGVEKVWVASPKPTQMTLAAAAVAGADALLAVGGAQAIAALAYGAGDVPACDAIVGPGNRWVTAAKQLVAGRVAIDMLAGPSELVVLADRSANPSVVAADLLAQAEHDVDALPVLITPHQPLADAVEAQLAEQLGDLPTAETARAALANGYTVIVNTISEGAEICNRLAPEHLQVHTEDADGVTGLLDHYGALFIGSGSAEVFGDYGAGPNHVLPTGGTARSVGGLSVFTFLRLRTWMRIDNRYEARSLAKDAAALARHEGLEAHARAAEKRL
jgi:phosphoribosyl-ATP pyrophosphohydrolase/phosphoribosyl-AMP cyclohydrolase/histidinol dehydrogenase